MQCVVKNSEYRMKLQQSGISEPLFESFVMDFTNKYGRFPNLDEIPRANSTQQLQDTLHITGGAANIEDILVSARGVKRVNTSLFQCDLYDLLDGDVRVAEKFFGEYMLDYSWAEDRMALLSKYIQCNSISIPFWHLLHG